MNVYTATEQAYKNGYEAGAMEFADKIFEEAPNITQERIVHLKIAIHTLAMRLISNNREQKGRCGKMKNGIYFEEFAIKDGKRYNAKIIDVSEVSKIMANSVMDGLRKIIGFEEVDHPTEKGGVADTNVGSKTEKGGDE